MKLILTIADASLLYRRGDATRMLEGGSLTIGRGQEADWVLPDAERQLSKLHCRLSFDDGRWTLLDSSTNGTFVGQSDEPLGKGNSLVLRDGDRFRLGDYRIDVMLLEAGAGPGASERPVAAAESETAGDAFDLFAETGPQGAAASASQAPGVASDPAEDPFAEQLPDLGRRSMSGDLPPLDIAGESIGGQGEAWRPDSGGPLFKGEGLGMAPAPAEQDAFQAPQLQTSGSRGSETIPDDWDLSADWAGSGSADAPPLGPAPASFQADPLEAAPLVPGGLDPALARFFAELGIDAAEIPEAERPEVMARAGAALREGVAGLRAALAGRAEAQSSLHVEQTLLAGRDNNPLKFSESDRDALTLLLTVRSAAFLDAETAMREASRDLQAHQMAVMAGMKAAVTALLERFDPQRLEGRLDEDSLLEAVLPASRKARYWEVFCKLYADLAAEANDDFLRLFGESFARAYRAQSNEAKRRG